MLVSAGFREKLQTGARGQEGRLLEIGCSIAGAALLPLVQVDSGFDSASGCSTQYRLLLRSQATPQCPPELRASAVCQAIRMKKSAQTYR